MKKILHIANWYPNEWDGIEGIFVREQFRLFAEVTECRLVNVQVRSGRRWFEYRRIVYSEAEEGYYVLTKIGSHRVSEIMTTVLLLWALFRSNYRQYDLLHFHIAYPLLTYYAYWKKLVRLPVLISEHWSAYHFNFYLPADSTKLERIKNIFRQKLPLITVSRSLLDDIQKFSGTADFPSVVIPNVIDGNYFHYRHGRNSSGPPRFFMVNVWRPIKKPFAMLEAFAGLASDGKAFELVIGGYGDLLEQMQAYVRQHGMGERVHFLGKLDKARIAQELSEADAYLYSSEYETFSVACAQALSSGCPLIGPPIPAIMEYSDESERVAVENNDAVSWEKALLYFMENRERFDHAVIAKKAQTYFSAERIKRIYADFLNKIAG